MLVFFGWTSFLPSTVYSQNTISVCDHIWFSVSPTGHLGIFPWVHIVCLVFWIWVKCSSHLNLPWWQKAVKSFMKYRVTLRMCLCSTLAWWVAWYELRSLVMAPPVGQKFIFNNSTPQLFQKTIKLINIDLN